MPAHAAARVLPPEDWQCEPSLAAGSWKGTPAPRTMQAWRLTPHLHGRIKELKGLMTFSKLVHPNIMKVTSRALSLCVQGGGACVQGGGAYLGV